MTGRTIYYKSLAGYKYQLTQDFKIRTRLSPPRAIEVDGFLRLLPSGSLTIKSGYCWDGPSGPTIDSPAFMRGSLVHDALYQLIRHGAIGREFRLYADKLLRRLCREDGMGPIRAWYVYRAVRWFGDDAAFEPDSRERVYAAP